MAPPLIIAATTILSLSYFSSSVSSETANRGRCCSIWNYCGSDPSFCNSGSGYCRFQCFSPSYEIGDVINVHAVVNATDNEFYNDVVSRRRLSMIRRLSAAAVVMVLLFQLRPVLF
ncbi:hypothetical protein LINGRAHAP2_LOCUS26538 [Linum grandiflorum]